MKPPRTPLSRHFFNPSSSSDLKHGQKGPHHTFVSYFLTSQSTHVLNSSKIPKSCLKDSSFGTVSIPKPQKNLDTVNKNSGDVLLGSTKNGKPIIKIAFFDQMASQFSQTRLFSAASNDPSRKPRVLMGLAKNEKPIIRTAFCDQMVSQFAQTRLFSAGPNDSSGDPIPVVATTRSPFDSSPTIDAGSSIRKPISLWPGMYHSPVTNALWEARSSIFERPSNATVDPSPSSDLTSKTPSKSRTRVLYNFSSDYVLREQYRNPWNEIRMGKLLEDLDALAGTISFKHCSNNDGTTRSLLLVTASVDKMLLKKPIRVDTDLTVEGAVTWVGRSSMDIQLEVIQTSPEASSTSESLALTANFTFVARDSETGKSAPINQILPETEKEKLLWEEAEERNKLRKKKKGQKKDIEGDEANGLNELLAEGRIFCDMPALADRDSILMKDTCLQNSLVCQPQQRNIHGRIFGGFLMRRAFELAYATAYAFAGSAPCFLEVDHVDFLKPVDVGNFLRLKSCVLYTELENPSQPLINVEVVAHVTRPELRSSEVSNNFYFTFTVQPDSLKDGKKIRNVVPATEEEARRVIERIDAEKS